MNYSDLLKLAAESKVTVSPAEAEAVETKTQSQSKLPLWIRMCMGRITAS